MNKGTAQGNVHIYDLDKRNVVVNETQEEAIICRVAEGTTVLEKGNLSKKEVVCTTK